MTLQSIKSQVIKKINKTPMVQSKRIFKPFVKSGTPFFGRTQVEETKTTTFKSKNKTMKKYSVMGDICERLQNQHLANDFFLSQTNYPQGLEYQQGQINLDCELSRNLYNSDEQVLSTFGIQKLTRNPSTKSMFEFSDIKMNDSFDSVSNISSASINSNDDCSSFSSDLFQQYQHMLKTEAKTNFDEKQSNTSTKHSNSILEFITNMAEGKETIDFTFDIDEKFENELVRALT